MGSFVALDQMFENIKKAIDEAGEKFSSDHRCSKCSATKDFMVVGLIYESGADRWHPNLVEVTQGWVYTTGTDCPYKRFCPACAKQLGLLE